jgi:hypothetical protein
VNDLLALTAVYFGVIATNGKPSTLEDAWTQAAALAEFALTKINGDLDGPRPPAALRLR